MSQYVTNIYSCEICEIGYVLDNICYKCNIKCIKCNQYQCLSCINNAELIGTECFCEIGYSGNETCEYVLFYVNPTISKDNILYLDFSDSLINQLAPDDIFLQINGSKIAFTLEMYTIVRYALQLKLQISIANGTLLYINFTKEIISQGNGILNTSQIIVVMNEYILITENPTFKLFSAISSTATSAATYAATSTSLLNPTPASLWSFINSIQMLIYIYLIDIQLDNRFSGFLIGLKKYMLFPNIFDYMSVSKGQDQNFQRAKDLGYTTNSILYNTGSYISSFLCFIGLYFLMYFLFKILNQTKYKQSKIASILNEKCLSYKYGFFLRFLIQFYLELAVACFIAYYSTNISIVEDALNLYLGLILGAIFVLTPFISMIIGFIKQKEVKLEQETPGLSLYASLFYEFKNDSKATQSQYYTVFFFRRLLFVIILFVLKDYPIIQLFLCEVLMCSVIYKQMLLFIIFTMPFCEKALNYANIVTELGLVLIFPIISLYLFDISTGTKTFFDYVLIIIVNTIVSSQMSVSLFTFSKTVIQKIKNRNKNKNKIAADEEELVICVHPPLEDNGEASLGHHSIKINNSPLESITNLRYDESDLLFITSPQPSVNEIINNIKL